ncbi:MAG: FAD-dependent oxidoreductase [Proteobacteria bacterium]|jgi:NADPH-dependent glutamate synthase beta subunit-like oxidoreductase|nr:FAD-dependent oxidoreductase [Pseudomonadota bacterium]
MPANSTNPSVGLTMQQAIAEAQRCLLCHDAPCSSGCPGGTDPGKFIRQIRFYNFKGAARTVLGNNPLGFTCGFVCPTDDTCGGACLRAGLDQPINIDGLQRFAADYGRRHGVKALGRGEPLGKKVAVVGAGPAGLAAASVLAEYGYEVTLFEARDETGGMLRYCVPRSRLPLGALDADLADIIDQGIEIRTDTKVDGAAKLIEEGFAAVFVAPGLWKAHSLPIEGMDAAGVTNAVDFLSLCHTDGQAATDLVRGKNVAVIGGGSVAMDVTHSARQLGANRIYAISLEGMNELPAMEDELATAIVEGVFFVAQCEVTKVLTEDGQVVGLEGREVEWKEPGVLLPHNALPIEGTSFTLRVGVVVQAIGQGATATAGQIVASTGRFIEVDDSMSTSQAGVYAGGDIVRGAGTVVAAVGDGKKAAQAIHNYLSQGVE